MLLGINLERPNLDIAHEGNSLDLKKVELELDRYLSEVATLDLYLKLMVPDLLVLHLTNLLSYRPNLAALLTALGLTTCFLAPPCYPLISAYCPFSIIMCCRRCSSVCFLSLLLTHAYYSRSSHFVLPLPRRFLSFDQLMYSLSLADSLLLSFSMLTNVYSPYLCICAAYQYVGFTMLESLDVLIQ